MQILTVSYSTTATHQRLPPVSATAKPPPTTSHHRKVTPSLPPNKVEILKSLEPWARENIIPFLKPVEKSWQPMEFLPDPTKPDSEFIDKVLALRDLNEGLPDAYFVVLVGDMITEEALPTYQTSMNRMDGVRDESGVSSSPWAVWTRAWTAEENRHGDLLRTYLYLSGRVDMLMIEKTVQYLIGAGMDPGMENDPYLGMVYASFQERATFVSHGNTARLAKEGGDPLLAKMCGAIAADEKRHGTVYAKVIEKLLEVDPNGAMVALGKMMRKKVTMPAHLMYDGQNPNLFEHFAFLAHRIGVYTPDDYANILEELVKKWRLEELKELKGDGRREQEFVCSLAPRIRKLQARADERAEKEGFQGLKFSWVFNRDIII